MAGVTAVLLAAGESTRMGRPKPLLPWDGDTLIGYQVRSLAAAGVSRTIVVLGHAAPEVAPSVRGGGEIEIYINPHYTLGKTTSVKLGVREAGPRSEALLLLSVDQPRPVSLLTLLLREHFHARRLITQPTYEGRGGHPVIFDGSLASDLLEISDERMGVREVMDRHRDWVYRVPVESPLALLDLNTEEQYRRAREVFPGVGDERGEPLT